LVEIKLKKPNFIGIKTYLIPKGNNSLFLDDKQGIFNSIFFFKNEK